MWDTPPCFFLLFSCMISGDIFPRDIADELFRLFDSYDPDVALRTAGVEAEPLTDPALHLGHCPMHFLYAVALPGLLV